jgi:hypothetical protein
MSILRRVMLLHFEDLIPPGYWSRKISRHPWEGSTIALRGPHTNHLENDVIALGRSYIIVDVFVGVVVGVPARVETWGIVVDIAVDIAMA